MRLENQKIIISGSTNGIGAAMARRFVAEGAQVLLHGRSREAGETLLNELGDAAALHIDDLSDPEAPPRIASAALEAFGRIDALVNNAAVSWRSTLEDTSADFFDKLLAINLRAPLLLVQATLDELEKSQGVVLNTGSVLAHTGLTHLLAYSVSKGGMMTMTRNMALSLSQRGVRVNQMNVGWTLTDNEHQLQLGQGQPENWLDNLPAVVRPSGALLLPEEIAEAAIYWVSPASRPITGSVFEAEQYPTIGRIPGS